MSIELEEGHGHGQGPPQPHSHMMMMQFRGPNYVDDDRHTQEAYKRNKGRLIEDNPYTDLEEFPDESSLFIGDLSRTVTEDMLMKLFSECGPVDGVDIKRDKVTKNNLGYGFVKFKDRQQAEKAKIRLNGMEIGGRAIRIGWAQKNTNLFVCLVGDIQEKITGEHLREIFSDFGPIYEEDTFVKRNKYGFVKFKHRAHAERAKAALDGKHLLLSDGYKTQKPVRIGWGDANTQRNCVHVQFEQNSASNVDLKEEDFKQQFQKFGTVNKVSLPRYSDKRLKGYGFIHFEENDEGEESAARAITELTASQIKGVVIMCNFGKRQNQRHKRFAQKKQGNEGGMMNDNFNQPQGMGHYDQNMAFDTGQNMNQMNQMNQNDFGQQMNANMANMGNNQGMNDMNNMQNMMMMNNMQNMQNMNMQNMAPPPFQNMQNMPNNMQNMQMNNMGPPQFNNPDAGIMNMNNMANMNPNMGNMPPPSHHMNPMMNNMQNNMAPPPPNAMPGPPLSGPNPFFPPNPMMNGPPSNLNNMINPMMMRNPNANNPQITVGVGPPNMMNINGVPPSPPPPNMPIPPDPSSFKINKSTEQDGNKGNMNNGGAPNEPNKFQLPFNNQLPPAFPAPQAPQLNMTGSNSGTGPNTPNRVGVAPNMMPTFLPPLGGMGNNPMFGGLSGLGPPPQLSPQLTPNPMNKTQSHSPHLNASPPNLFVPPYPSANPPPPNLSGLKPLRGMPGLPGGIPSPNLSTLPGMGQIPGFNPQRPTSPSPPVSPLMNAPIPFLPSPQMLPNNPGMPPINLNNPGMLSNNPLLNKNQMHGMPHPNMNQAPINLTNKFNNMNLSGVHKPLNMQNPMLNRNLPNDQQ